MSGNIKKIKDYLNKKLDQFKKLDKNDKITVIVLSIAGFIIILYGFKIF